MEYTVKILNPNKAGIKELEELQQLTHENTNSKAVYRAAKNFPTYVKNNAELSSELNEAKKEVYRLKNLVYRWNHIMDEMTKEFSG